MRGGDRGVKAGRKGDTHAIDRVIGGTNDDRRTVGALGGLRSDEDEADRRELASRFDGDGWTVRCFDDRGCASTCCESADEALERLGRERNCWEGVMPPNSPTDVSEPVLVLADDLEEIGGGGGKNIGEGMAP